MDTKTLIVGQKVDIRSGAYYHGSGEVIKLTPSGGEVRLDEPPHYKGGVLRFDSDGITQLQDTIECGPWYITDPQDIAT